MTEPNIVTYRGRGLLKGQRLDLPFDPAIEQTIGDVDWNTHDT